MPRDTSAATTVRIGQQGPDAFFLFTEMLERNSAASTIDDGSRVGSISSTEHLYQLAESCNRGALRHLQSLRRTFGLLHARSRDASAAGLESSSHISLSPSPIGKSTATCAGHEHYPVLQRQTSNAAHSTREGTNVVVMTEFAADEMRQRRLIADMYVSKWKRMHESFHSDMDRMALAHADRQRMADEDSARKAKQNHDAFKNGLAMLRNAGRM